MKNHTFKLAIVFGALALSACTAGESSDKNERLSAIFGDNQQSLDADGHADCDAIHSVLLQNGIDPELLDPEIVREACIDSPDGDRATCDVVAYSCFGPQDDCHDPEPPPIDACDELWRYIDVVEPQPEPGVDPDGSQDHDEAGLPYFDLDQLVAACDAGQYPEDVCALVYQCVGVDPGPGPGPDPDICEVLRADDGRDIDEQEAWQLCLDMGYGDEECAELIGICLNHGEPTDPGEPGDPTDPNEPGEPTDPGEPQPGDDCQAALDELAERGYQGSADGGFSAEECIQMTQEVDLCVEVERACF